MRSNLDVRRRAIRELTKSIAGLSQAERVLLLLASYMVSLTLKRPIVIDVAKHSTRQSIGTALLYLFRGF